MSRKQMEKIIRNILPLLLVLVFVLAAGGCGGGSDSKDTSDGGDDDGGNIGTLVVTGPSYSISGSTVTITGGGSYTVSGRLADGQIRVNAPSQAVTLTLDGVEIACSYGPAIVFLDASSGAVLLAAGTDNDLVDGGSDDEHDAVIFSSIPLTIGGSGNLTITGTLQEGIASDSTLTIDGGNIWITTVDDGLNSGGDLTVNGGYLYIEAGGDGIDSNSNMYLNGGTVIALGAMSGGDGGLDADDPYKIVVRGGTIIATGQDIAQPDASSTQVGMLINFDSQTTGTLVHIHSERSDTAAEEILTFKPAKAYRAFFYSSAELEQNVAYQVYLGGSSTGTSKDGVYTGGDYSGGTQQSHSGDTDFTVTETIGVFDVGQQSGPGGNPPGQPGMNP